MLTSVERHPFFRRTATWRRAAAALLTALVAGCGRPERVLLRQGDLMVTGAYAHPSAGDAGAAYVQLRNAGSTPDTLLDASGPDSSSAMLMTTAGGHMAMQKALVIGPGERLAMQPGGVHVMFSGLRGEYRIGDTLPLALHFARGGTVRIMAVVVPFGELPE